MRQEFRVLLVDDDEDEYILMKSLLRQLPGERSLFRVHLDWVNNYQDALAACQRERHDIYFVDYHLGAHNGLNWMREAAAAGCPGPFVLLTGQGSYELDVLAQQQGVAEYLPKETLNEQILERTIRYTIERHQAQQELERRVQERTQELASANEVLNQEVRRREAVEEILRESELRFRTLTETTSAAIFIVQDQIIRYANPATRFVTGYAPEALVGRELWTLAHADYQSVLRHLEKAGSWLKRHEIKIIHRRGEERWLDMTIGSMQYQGKPAALLTAFDITERDRAERQLREATVRLEKRVDERTAEIRRVAQEAQQRAEALDGLHRATAALLSTLELDELLCQILDAAQSAIPAAEHGMLHLASPATGELHLRATLGFSSQRLHLIRTPHTNTIPSLMARSNGPLLVQDLQELPDLPAHEAEQFQGARSLILSPLQYAGRTLGTLSLSSTTPNAFDESNLRLLTSFAATTTAALQNALLHAEVKQMAASDPLTGIFNRRTFFELGRRAIDHFQRFNHPLSIAMLDLDNLKYINDHFSHAAGDQALRLVAEHTRSSIRERDIFARYGGDEFVLLLPDTDLGTAAAIANRIRETISAVQWQESQGVVPVSISIGVAPASHAHNTLEDLLAEADTALYQAKSGGRNRVEIGS